MPKNLEILRGQFLGVFPSLSKIFSGNNVNENGRRWRGGVVCQLIVHWHVSISSVVVSSRDSEEARAVISHKVGGGGGVLKENKDGNYGCALSLPLAIKRTLESRTTLFS